MRTMDNYGTQFVCVCLCVRCLNATKDAYKTN